MDDRGLMAGVSGLTHTPHPLGLLSCRKMTRALGGCTLVMELVLRGNTGK